MSAPRKNKKFSAFALTLTKSPGDTMKFNLEKLLSWTDKFGEAFLVTKEQHKSGHDHYHIYQETKKEYTTSDFKKKYWRGIIDHKKYEDRDTSNMFVKPCNGFQGWIMYILKEYEPMQNDNIVATSLNKDYIMKIHDQQKEFVESKKFKTVSRATYLNTFSKRIESLKDSEENMQWIVFEAHKRVLLVDKVLPPGLKLEDYSWIVAEWSSTKSNISWPFAHVLQRLTCLKGFRDEDNYITGGDIESDKILRKNPGNSITFSDGFVSGV